MGRVDQGWTKDKRATRHAVPLLYELISEGITVSFAEPSRLNPPLGDGSFETSHFVASAHADALLSSIATSRRDRFIVSVSRDSREHVLVDLLEARLVSVVGEHDDVSAVLCSMAKEVSHTRLRHHQEIVLVGEEVPLDLRGKAQHVSSVEELALTRMRRPSKTVTTSAPLLVFIWPDALSGHSTNALTDLIPGLVGSAFVIGNFHPHAHLVIAPDPVETATSVYLRRSASKRVTLDLGHKDQIPSKVVEVKVLGPTEITGIDGSLSRRPKLTELVVYLALHPEGAATRSWTTALWPDRRVPAQTVANRLSEARGLLGFASDDRPRLRKSGERHCLVGVGSDWERFEQLSRAERDPASWREALALLRGRPFCDLHEGQWALFEGLVAEVEQAIATCALRYGEHCLSHGDPDEAVFAAQQALRAVPYDERIHRLLMRASDALGNRAGVEATLRHLALVLEIDGNPLHGVHPETAALYSSLITQPSSR